MENRWTTFKEAVVGACEDVLGRPQTNRKPWISDETLQKVEETRKAKQELNQAKTRADKRAYINTIAEDAEEAAGKKDLKALYATTRLLSGRRSNPNRPVRDKEGKLLTTTEDQLSR